MNYQVNQRIFLNHPTESWIVGTIEQIVKNEKDDSKTRYTCVPQDQRFKEVSLLADDIHDLKDEALVAENEDLLEMTELHEATLLRCIENRYNKDVIYTFLGPLIVALNPFKWTIPAYQDSQMINYINRKKVLPHSWSVADEAFRDMVKGNGNHTILVSGESGAGKTEACKTVINYLTELSCSMTGDDAIKKNALEISERIKESSPILEAFGNAKTKNNDNSSRFGKFIRLQFDRKGIIQGANIVNYLLEKSRLMKQGPDERSYHIFYQLFAGASRELKEKLKLTKPENYVCIMQGNCTSIEGVDDKADYDAVIHAMNIVGISADEQESIFRVVAAILHMQNIRLLEKEDSSEVENEDELKIAAELLKIDAQGLKDALLTKTITIMNKSITSPLTGVQAADARDALSKALYNELFNWIIRRLNERTFSQTEHAFIGLLDIFGFETFEVNSFEQFCINFANETLQNHYNNYTFKRDQREYEEEGIDATTVSFRDNTPCIELIHGSQGILRKLDDQSKMPRATDQTFINLIKGSFEKKNPFFITDPRKQVEFSIAHYAGKVEYNVENWLEKNRDVLKPDLVNLVRASGCNFVKSLLPSVEESTNLKITVAGAFKKQLDDLLSVVSTTTPHWIRTIKPHPAKKPNMFSRFSVMNQLRSSGVLDTVRLRREGYCVRIPLQDFWKKYRILIDEASTENFKESSERIIHKIKFDKFKAQVGTVRVFMRSEAYTEIELMRNQKLMSSILKIQRYARMFLSKKRSWLRREALRLQREREEYEIHKEELIRMAKIREEQERLDCERKEREAAERKRLEELRKIEEERLFKEKEERERIEKRRRELEEKERQKLEELKRKQQERISELARLENERKERERLERERIEREKAEALRLAEEEREREIEERRQEMVRREQERIEQEKADRIAKRKEKFLQRQTERQSVQETARKRKEKAQRALRKELSLRNKRDDELQQLAIIAKTKLEEEKRAWEEEEWKRLQLEILLEQHQKEERFMTEREKMKRIEFAQERKKQMIAERTRYIHEKMARVERRQQIIHQEREDYIRNEVERRLDKKKELERRRQEQEIILMEKQSQLAWEIEKEKRRSEMRAELKRRMHNEKIRDQWRVEDLNRTVLKEKEKDDADQYLLETQLKREYEQLAQNLERNREGARSENMFKTGMAKKDQLQYEENLDKLKKKISGVFTHSPSKEYVGVGRSPSKKTLNRSLSASISNSSPLLRRPAMSATASPGSLPKRASSAMSFGSPMYGNLSHSASPRPGSFSNIYST